MCGWCVKPAAYTLTTDESPFAADACSAHMGDATTEAMVSMANLKGRVAPRPVARFRPSKHGGYDIIDGDDNVVGHTDRSYSKEIIGGRCWRLWTPDYAESRVFATRSEAGRAAL